MVTGYNRWGDIYKTLKSAGFDVYSPAQHEGECITPYIVIAVSSVAAIGNFSSTQNLYDLMLYIPRDSYSMLEDYTESVKQAMKSLEPGIKPVNYQTPPYYDDSVKGHMVSIQYRNNRKLV